MKNRLLRCAIALNLLLTGCVYKTDLYQGNIVSNESVDQLQPGMSREQVLALLGSPLIVDSFHTNRWDYYSYSKVGKTRKESTSHIIIIFEEDRLKTIKRSLQKQAIDS